MVKHFGENLTLENMIRTLLMEKMMKEEIKEIEMVSVDIPIGLLTKLTWVFPSGTNEQRVKFALNKMVEAAQNSEGLDYPEDELPCNTFGNVEVIK